MGMVRKLDLAEDLKGIYVDAEVYPSARQLLGKDTQFWLVKPTASLSGVSGLDALVSGNYIAIQGASKQSNNLPDVYQALTKTPQDLHSSNPNGLRITLRSKDLGSVNIGSKILFRKIPIGEIYSFNLDEDGRSVVLRAYIDEEYDHIITSESRFWNVSGINASVGFDGVDVSVESLAALIGGGIAVDSPAKGDSVEPDTEFKLYPDLATAGRGIPINIKLPDDNNISPGGAPLVYRGIEVGQITGVRLSRDRQDIIAQATVEPAYQDMLTTGSQFLLEEASLSLAGVDNLSNFIRGNFLTLLPGSGEPTRDFRAVKQDELNTQTSGNLSISLLADQSFGLESGAAVLYKGISVGHVTSSHLAGEKVKINLLIDSQYRELIRSQNKFYIASSVSANFDAAGLDVKVPPLQHLLTGSISFYSAGSTKIHNEYPLYSSKELAKLAQFDGANKQVLTLLSPDLPPVSSGTPLYYRYLPVGQVLDYQLGHSGMEVKVLIEKQFSHLINKDTVFWNHSGVEIDAGLSGVKVNAEPLSRVLSGGIAFDTIPGVENKTGRFYKLYDNQDAARQFGEMITLVADDSNGIKKGAAINFKGVKVGEITLVSPQFAQSEVEFKARIYPEYAKTIAREGAKFWLVTPEIGLTGIKNLSSAIAPTIEVMPSGKGKVKTQFELSSSKPLSSGYEFVLQAETKGSVAVNTPILYREIEVGRVTDVRLGELADRVIIKTLIDPDYAYLIRENTLFWNVSGLDVSIGLSGANVKAGTVESLLRGGIAFATPEDGNLLPTAKNGRAFYLYKQADPSWLEWRTAIPKP
ncbi:paraquat-inducible protein B [Vibrio ishigakensis]|uniref:Paraquat-inducible protein B n=1 Tax=Vibrio ishigakensis TaxID=1481914 RepID=A0A0B8QME4_9VIBR|nr:paraquat-inducible protein B [Vibrio ishigakensis]